LRANPAADELRPAFAIRILVGTLVVHLRHVAGRAIEKDDNCFLTVVSLNNLFKIANVVCGDTTGASRGVAREVNHAAKKLLLLVPDTEDADFRIGRAGRFDNARVALAGMRDGSAIAHFEATIESHSFLDPLAHAGASLHA